MKTNDETLDVEVTLRATEIVLLVTRLVHDKRREPLLALQHLAKMRDQVAALDAALVKIAVEEHDGVPTELQVCVRCGGREMDECRCTPEQVAKYEESLEPSDVPFGH